MSTLTEPRPWTIFTFLPGAVDVRRLCDLARTTDLGFRPTSVRIRSWGADQVESLEYNLAGNGKSKILATSGFVKLVRRKDGPVVGVHMIGARVGELVGEGQLIVGWEAYPEDVAALVHAHPTQNEALGEAHLALAGKPLHAHN